MRKEAVIEQIRDAFAATPYPGDRFLQGSFEGSEPYDQVSAFVGKTDWRALDFAMLDNHYCALSFFSEGGFRFFLPAYLIADVRDELATADPLFHLSHGFFETSTEMALGAETFRRITGGRTFVNPKRYGAMAWSDAARQRLSVFTREEAQAIVSYMAYKRELAAMSLHASRIDAALNEFWLDRARNAPTRADLEIHAREEERFSAALLRNQDEKK